MEDDALVSTFKETVTASPWGTIPAFVLGKNYEMPQSEYAASGTLGRDLNAGPA
jgi:hypothetical protein